MKRGEDARGAFYVAMGEVELVELGKTVGPGTLLGEIGLFAPDGLRVATARARTDVSAARIDYDQFKQLYFQNPEFGFRLLRLVVGRLQENRELSTRPT
jgi:CRP-like cAMP-binding protein